MASQNVAPSSSSQKSMSSTKSGSKDGYSVTKRLRQDLTTLMVSLNMFYTIYQIINNRLCCPDMHTITYFPLLPLDVRQSFNLWIPSWRQSIQLDCHPHRSQRHTLRRSQLQTQPHFPCPLPLCTAHHSIPDIHIPPKRR